MTDNQERARLKKKFYEDMDALNSDNETPDPGRQASEAAWKRSRQTSTSKHQARPTFSSLARSLSDTTVAASALPTVPDAHASPATAKSNVQLSHRPDIGTLKKSASDFPKTSTSTKLGGKRKRESVAALVPEDQQIFKNLRLYFFPNNDNNPARRMRILKATQFGATWERDWNCKVTHVVLDKDTNFDHLLKYLRLEKLPDTVIVVPESYPAECLSYKTVLDHKQNRFAVKGATPVLLPRPESSSFNHSVQHKSASKAPPVRKREAPQYQDGVVVAATTVSPSNEHLVEIYDDDAQIADSFQTFAAESDKEFAEAIRQAKALEHVPLEDEDGDSRPSSADGIEYGNEEQSTGLRLLHQQRGKFKTVSDKFACMQKHTGDKVSNPNQPTIEVLQQMADYYGQTGDEWRVRAYRKAISTLRAHPTRVCSKEEAAGLPNIGGRLAEKIEEIAMTNRLRRLDSAKAEPGDTVLRTFMGVYGAGIVQATRWVDQGYKTLEELMEKAELTDNQRIGIQHYEDFNSRIPRAEVERHGNIVRGALQAIDPEFRVIVGGSYRRGSKDSGDIDCILTRPNTSADHLRNVVLGQLVPQLTEKGFLVASLAVTSKDDGSKWHGASCIPGTTTWRRLDLLLVPSDELGAALIYFTGNDIFNRSLRLLASTKGLRLNQRGLYRDVLRGAKRKKITDGTLVEGKDERKIFEALSVPWRPPEHRIC